MDQYIGQVAHRSQSAHLAIRLRIRHGGVTWDTLVTGVSPTDVTTPVTVHGARRVVRERSTRMTDHIYRVTEIVGSSHEGVDQAIRNAITRASQTVRNLDWFEVTQVRGQIENGQIEHYQVGLKVGFRIEDAD